MMRLHLPTTKFGGMWCRHVDRVGSKRCRGPGRRWGCCSGYWSARAGEVLLTIRRIKDNVARKRGIAALLCWGTSQENCGDSVADCEGRIILQKSGRELKRHSVAHPRRVTTGSLSFQCNPDERQRLSLNLSQFVEDRMGYPWARGDIEEARVFAGDQPHNGEEVRRASSRFDVRQRLINCANPLMSIVSGC